MIVDRPSFFSNGDVLRMTVAGNMADPPSRQTDVPRTNNNVENHREKSASAYERLTRDLSYDEKYLKEITLGKRIGFYRIRGELGTGNFCQVKMGIHSLTRGKFLERLRHSKASENVFTVVLLVCRESGHQNLGQNKTGPEDTEIALAGDFLHGKFAPSERYSLV